MIGAPWLIWGFVWVLVMTSMMGRRRTQPEAPLPPLTPETEQSADLDRQPCWPWTTSVCRFFVVRTIDRRSAGRPGRAGYGAVISAGNGTPVSSSDAVHSRPAI